MANTFIRISDLTELSLPGLNGSYKIELSNPTVSSNSVTLTNVAVFTANIIVNRFNSFNVSQGAPAANLTFAGNVAWNLETIQIATLTLTANANVDAPLGMRFRTHALIINQGNGGSKLITWNPVFKWTGGTPPTLSTANNAKDIITFICDGTNMYGVATANLR